MKQMLSLLIVLFVSTNSLAQTVYRGQTSKNEACTVSFNLESQNIGFYLDEDVNFGFIASESELLKALQNGGNQYVIKGSDGPVRAQLTLKFDSKRELKSATYNQVFVILPKTVECNNLKAQ